MVDRTRATSLLRVASCIVATFATLFVTAAVVRGAEPTAGSDTRGRLRYYYPVPKADPALTVESDLCVYGATPAGITAAIQATRMGKSAVLVEFGRHVGGMTSSGLSATDGGGTAGGIAEEFYRVVGKSRFEPASAEAAYKMMLKKAGVRVFYEHRLARAKKDGASITQLGMENGNTFKAMAFVDATYEGDLLAMAGASYTVGREANSLYGETVNGIRTPVTTHNFEFPVDPYVTPGDSSSGLLPGFTNVAPDAPGKTGDGDKRVQAYNFRMFLAKLPEAIPFPKPPGYDAARYELLLRYLQGGVKRNKLPSYVQLGPGDSNNSGAFSTDDVGMSDGWPEGDYEQREKLYQEHVNYQQGLMYFLANDPRAPEQARAPVAAFGLAKGNFSETGGWPHQLYVREGRRMISDYVMTEHNCRSKVKAEDSVGLAEYTMDSHNCQRYVLRKNGTAIAQNEGDAQFPIPHPYPVSYRAMTPKLAECTNLLVPVCLSSTHMAYGSIRMEPVFMALGQSAGTAACLAIDAGVPVQKVNYTELRARLLADKQNLDWPIAK